jgi:hypothetical protein
MKEPALPLFELSAGRWQASVFDPRPDPRALGARYVHGGYVQKLCFADRCLTGRASPAWDPYVGVGIPDVFELSLGEGQAGTGRPFMRMGAGRLIQGQGSLKGLPDQPVPWALLEQTPTRVRLACRDSLDGSGSNLGYELERTVEVRADGLDCTTRLTMAVNWNQPVFWFSHPFFAQTAGDRTGFSLPGTPAVDGPFTRDTEGCLHLPAEGGLVNITGIWGQRGAILCHLDPALGGGVLSVEVDRPLDHAVLYASPRAASPEPQLARAWKNGETAAWTVRYRWFDPPLD